MQETSPHFQQTSLLNSSLNSPQQTIQTQQFFTGFPDTGMFGRENGWAQTLVKYSNELLNFWNFV